MLASGETLLGCSAKKERFMKRLEKRKEGERERGRNVR
jgi:hypothetical protein